MLSLLGKLLAGLIIVVLTFLLNVVYYAFIFLVLYCAFHTAMWIISEVKFLRVRFAMWSFGRHKQSKRDTARTRLRSELWS